VRRDAVADHCDGFASTFNEAADAREFFFRKRTGNYLPNAELTSHSLGYGFGVPREQNRSHTHLVKCVDGFFGLMAHRIRNRD
jgi:hypothetical protein